LIDDWQRKVGWWLDLCTRRSNYMSILRAPCDPAQVWLLTTRCLRTDADFRQVVVDYAGEAAGFGAVYVEGTFSPGERVIRGVGWDEIFTGYTEGAVEAFERHGVVVRLTRATGRDR
jgi:aminodeoxyfutalosine deaminase